MVCLVHFSYFGYTRVRRQTESVDRMLSEIGKSFVKQHENCLVEFRLERRDDEQNGERNGYRLCKNQPQPLHGIVSNEA